MSPSPKKTEFHFEDKTEFHFRVKHKSVLFLFCFDTYTPTLFEFEFRFKYYILLILLKSLYYFLPTYREIVDANLELFNSSWLKDGCYWNLPLIRLPNHLHRHIFTVLLWSLTPRTMPDTVKFIGYLGQHI